MSEHFDYDDEVARHAAEIIEEKRAVVLRALAEDRTRIPKVDEMFSEGLDTVAFTLEDAEWATGRQCDADDGDDEDSAREEFIVSAMMDFRSAVQAKAEEWYDELREGIADVVDGCEADPEGLSSAEADGALLKLVFDGGVGRVWLSESATPGGATVTEARLEYPDSTVVVLTAPDPAPGDALSAVGTVVLEHPGDLTAEAMTAAARRVLAEDALREWKRTALPDPEPVEPGSDEEKTLLEEWIERSEAAGTDGGAPFGSAYIDARRGAGYGEPDALAYVRFDNETAGRVPHLRGRYRRDVREYLEETFGSAPKP